MGHRMVEIKRRRKSLRKQDSLDRFLILHALAEDGRPVGELLCCAEAPC
jgi:hypothetical protein